MYFYVDESGNTGLELFDPNQPTLYYGVLRSHRDLDVVAAPLLTELRRELGVERIHANELGVGRLTPIADRLARFSRKHDLQFSLLKVAKPDHAVITFFDQVFDSGLNKAVSWHHYFTPLRYPLLFKVAHLFDEGLAKDAWKARRELNSARAAEMLVKLCKKLLTRVDELPDARSRELVSGALKWAAANPFEISYGVGNHDTALQISPNLIGFQQVLQTIALQSSRRKRKVYRITVDRQNEFNGAQGELASWYEKLRGHKADMGPGMPSFDYSWMPKVPPTFTPGDASGGLEIVDVTLWIAKRLQEDKPLSPELENLFWTQARLGWTDQVSLAGIDERWRHLVNLPEPEKPLPAELQAHFDRLERERQSVVAAL
ncbi:hypothetical protein CN193_22085 [Sinorhizobium meliloti]|uniref:DUF3800 domain-containing protein n=1 Tax=Rhizobium meliloti TaxID=382 RepID=UPI000FD6C1C2|nr:DUF3800 domain-containing protein [Sinorhizobium meliloti]RVI98966.1 hypothetical protein CN193_22085 [Sinorhizobium meliloti]